MYRFNSKSRTWTRKTLLSTVLILLLSLLVASCGNSSKASSASAPMAPAPSAAARGEADAVYEAAEEGLGNTALEYKGLDGSSIDDIQVSRKLIMSGNVSIETLEFDASVEAIDRLVEDYKGFAETRTVLGKSRNSRALRSATYVIRIPAESFETVLKSMSSIGTVLESTSEGTDITDKYYDSETRIKALKVQEQTLLDILAKASKLEDVITLETRLAEIRYEIESIENTLNNYDRLVAYSRINIYIQEADDMTETKPIEKQLNERISGAFARSVREFRVGLEDFLVWLVESWISLLFLAAIVVAAVLVLKKKRPGKRLSQKLSVEEAPKDIPEDKK